MRAAVFDGKDITLKEVDKPIVKDTQVLIRVRAAGICGTDLAIIKGHLPTSRPLILGHEFAGEVTEIGKKVKQSWLRKRATSEINSNIDNTCYYCQRKMFTQCISRKALGIDIDGAFAEYIAVESYLLHEIPDSVPYNEATFIEPLAAAYQTFEMMPLGKDDNIIAIFGIGKLGLLICQVAELKGLEIIAIDGSNKKLDLAKKFGAKYLINRVSAKNIPGEIKDLTRGLGADIVIDTTGNPNAFSDIVASCRTRGKIHVKSTHGDATFVNLTDIVVREITLYTSRCGPFDKAIENLATKKIQVKELISKEFPLEKIHEAFASYDENRDNIKTVLII
jgi:threonine dehydrogenase-like Zn-dependent dehydrogenase